MALLKFTSLICIHETNIDRPNRQHYSDTGDLTILSSRRYWFGIHNQLSTFVYFIKSVSYQDAKNEFADFIEDAKQFVTTVSEPGPPTTFAGLVKSHEELKALVELIYIDSQELLEGLTSSDTGERRTAALESFNNNITQFQEKIEEIVAANTSG